MAENRLVIFFKTINMLNSSKVLSSGKTIDI